MRTRNAVPGDPVGRKQVRDRREACHEGAHSSSSSSGPSPRRRACGRGRLAARGAKHERLNCWCAARRRACACLRRRRPRMRQEVRLQRAEPEPAQEAARVRRRAGGLPAAAAASSARPRRARRRRYAPWPARSAARLPRSGGIHCVGRRGTTIPALARKARGRAVRTRRSVRPSGWASWMRLPRVIAPPRGAIAFPRTS